MPSQWVARPVVQSSSLYQRTWFDTALMIGFDCLFFRGLEGVNPRPFDTAAEKCWHRQVLASAAGCSRRFLVAVGLPHLAL